MQLSKLIEQADRIALISHINPDGDAVGSVSGLLLGLQSLGKEVTATLVHGVPEIFSFIPGSDQVMTTLPSQDSFDLCLLLDANDLNRTGAMEEMRGIGKSGKLGGVDHHPKGDLAQYTKATMHDTDAASTTQIIYSLLLELGCKITPAIATALLTGLYTDTGGFQYSNTSNNALEVAADLMRHGGRLQKIVQEISHSKSLSGLKLLGFALERLKLTCNGRCAVSVVTHEDITTTGASSEDLGGIIGNFCSLPGIQVSLLLSELEPGIIRGSLRTGDQYSVNVSRLGKLLGGGGHPKASGFAINGSIVIENGTWKVVAQTEKN